LFASSRHTLSLPSSIKPRQTDKNPISHSPPPSISICRCFALVNAERTKMVSGVVIFWKVSLDLEEETGDDDNYGSMLIRAAADDDIVDSRRRL
ncbi:unnamed protein product, partial [Linum tenue]